MWRESMPGFPQNQCQSVLSHVYCPNPRVIDLKLGFDNCDQYLFTGDEVGFNLLRSAAKAMLEKKSCSDWDNAHQF